MNNKYILIYLTPMDDHCGPHFFPEGGWMSFYWGRLVIDFWFWKTKETK